MHKTFWTAGGAILAIGVTMLFGQAVRPISGWADWGIIGGITVVLGAGLLIAGVVLWVVGRGATRSRLVRYMTNPTTGSRVFRNQMSMPIRIVGIEKSDPHVDHLAVGLPWESNRAARFP